MILRKMQLKYGLPIENDDFFMEDNGTIVQYAVIKSQYVFRINKLFHSQKLF